MEPKDYEVVVLDYEKTLEVINKQVDILFKIKEWAIFSSSAIIAFGFSQKSYLPLAANVALVICFYFTELFYREFHFGCIKRAENLENIIQLILKHGNAVPEDYKFGIGGAMREIGKSFRNPVKILFSNPVLHKATVLTYLLILLVTATAMIVLRFIR